MKIQKVPSFELNRSQGNILRKISIYGQKMNFELDITPNNNFFQNLGSINSFSTTKSFKKVLIWNSKSVCFQAKSLARHYFEENIHFCSKNQFWTGLDITAKWKLFSKFGLHKQFLYHQKFQKRLYLKFKKCPFFS